MQPAESDSPVGRSVEMASLIYFKSGIEPAIHCFRTTHSNLKATQPRCVMSFNLLNQDSKTIFCILFTFFSIQYYFPCLYGPPSIYFPSSGGTNYWVDRAMI